jgi:hypothetical protein
MYRMTWSLLSCSAVLLMAADTSWKNKDASQWSVQDAQQVLRDSPWVKKSLARILPPRTEDEQRQSGRMGGGTGGDLELFNPAVLIGATKPSRGFAANMQQRKTLYVCWESAAPVRSAESKIGDMDAPTWDGDYYAVAVYGVPGVDIEKGTAAELRKTAYLRREGKKDLLPARVEIVATDDKRVIVLFLFSRSQAITKAERDIWFAAQIGQLFVEQSFDAAEMQFQGKLEL